MGCEPKSKWFPPPNVQLGFSPLSSLQHGFHILMEIFRGIFCRTLKSESFLFYHNLQSASNSFTCDFNILQMQQSSKLGMARFSWK